MAYDASEIKGLVKDVWEPFNALDGPESDIKKIEAGTYPWESVIPAELGTPVPATARFLTEIVGLIDRVLSIPIRPVVNLSKFGETADKERDTIETFDDYWRFRTDPHGYHRRTRRDNAIRSRFAANILSINPYAPDSDDYDEHYWRWNLDSPDPASIGVLQRDGQITLGVLKEEIPYLEMAKYLSGRKEKEPAREFLTRKLGGLKLGDGSAPWSERASEHDSLKKITRCIVYTDEDIAQYIEVGRGNDSSSKSYAQVEATEPNPFGQVPIVLFPGIYRPHTDVSEAYEGIMWPIANSVRNLILMASIALTIYGNPKLIDQMDVDTAQQMLASLDGPNPQQLLDTLRTLQQPQVDAQGRVGRSVAFGDVADMTPKLDAGFATALQFFWDDLNRQMTRWQAVFPDPDTVEKSTAAGLIASIEQGQRSAEQWLAVMVAGEQKLLEMVHYDIAQTYKRDVSFKVGGQELTVTLDGFESGSEYTFTPDMAQQFVDGSAWVSLEPVPATGAQQAAAVRQEIEIQAAVGVKNSKRLYEAAGETNVTSRMEEDAALTNAEYMGPGAAQMAMQDVINEYALQMERPAEIIRGVWIPQFGQGEQQGQGQANTGYTYNPPPIPQTSGANGSTAPGVGA